jgi:hypothetical protein
LHRHSGRGACPPPFRHGRYAVKPPVAPLQKAVEDYEDALLKVAEQMAAEPLEKFDETKVERDESGRFSAKAGQVYAGARAAERKPQAFRDAVDGAMGALALSQGAYWAGRLARMKLGGKAPGTALVVLPSAGQRIAGGLKRHGAALVVGGALGAMRGHDSDADGVMDHTGFALRTAGRISAGAAIGELAGVGGQLALAAATKGRFRGAALPNIGGAVGGGLATVAALDLSSRHRNREASSGS